jgi:hypothetical protein
MRDGMIPGIDLQSLKTEAQRLFEQMRAAYSGRDIKHRTRAELFPPTFPNAPE